MEAPAAPPAPGQTETAYTDSVLQVNQCYGYTVTARDSAVTPNPGTASTKVEVYTAANVPSVPVVGTPTVTTLTVSNAPNSNPAITTFLIAVDDDGDGSADYVSALYVLQADGSDAANSTLEPGIKTPVANSLDKFTVVNSSGTNPITALTVTTTNTTAIASVEIQDSTGNTMQYFTTDSTPNVNAWEFSGGTFVPVGISIASFTVLFTADTHAGLGAGTYAVTV